MSLIPDDIRAAVTRRARNRCEYCLLSQDSQVATFPVDLVIPRLTGGRTVLENLALSCPQCNAAKWIYVEATDPESGQVVPLFNPRTQVWVEHFRWSDLDSTLIEGRTPSARATIERLGLNSESRRNIRRWLMAVGIHPPE